MSFAVRSSRFPYMCRALLRFPHLSFIPPVPYPPLRGTFPLRGRLCIGDSDSLANGALETIFPDLFHTARTLSGSLRPPPSPRGEGFVSGIPPSPSNLCPFGAPPSIGRRECPREPLPLEGAAERNEAGLASFLGGEAASSLPSPLGKAGCVTALGCSYIACLRRSPRSFSYR